MKERVEVGLPNMVIKDIKFNQASDDVFTIDPSTAKAVIIVKDGALQVIPVPQ